ncbi:MAG: DUF3987 domain-containing protein [Spirosomataceae bacterium]
MSQSQQKKNQKITIEALKKEAQNVKTESSGSTSKQELNPFPIAIFPNSIQLLIRTLCDCMKFPIDYMGASILYVASIGIGNTHRIKIKTGWMENCVLFLCLIGRAGTNKSHPLGFALQPIFQRDKVAHGQYSNALAEYQILNDMSKKDRQEQGLEEPKIPKLRKYLLSDYTPESVSFLHSNNLRGIGVYVDELAGWFKNFNRYNKGSEQETWLSIWSAKPMITDRKSGNSIFIEHPFISVIGTIQNGLLDEISKDSREQNGFLDRILFAIPENLKKEAWSEQDIDIQLVEAYNSIIGKLFDLDFASKTNDSFSPTVLELTPYAKELLFDWQRENTNLCNSTENETLAGIYSKFDIHICRFALILQVLRWACDEDNKSQIGKEAIEGAIKLVEYFRRNAEKVHYLINTNNPLDKLPRNKQKLYDKLPEQFTTNVGLTIAIDCGFKERNFKEFLNDRTLFERITHGEYIKLY